MRKALSVFFVVAVLSYVLTGCSSTGTNPMSPAPAESVPVSLTMTDEPPAGVSVLFFQVSLTNATLTSSSGTTVSLLGSNGPVAIDITRLQALAAFLSTANVPAGTYNSLSLSFADPKLVMVNTSNQALATSCALGTVCQFTPTIDNTATVTLSGAPFPVTVAANSPLGFLVDFHLNAIIQQDLSVNLGAANGVTVTQFRAMTQSGPPQFGSVMGTVQSIAASANQFTLTTAWGRTFTFTTSTSTAFNGFPASACATGSIACLAAGQSVQVQIGSLETTGTLLATQVSYLQAAGEQTVEGTIMGIEPQSLPTGETVVQVILHRNPTDNTSLPLGGMASVTIANGATFSVDTNGFTLPTGEFTGVSDLTRGQSVRLNVVSGTLTGPSNGNGAHGGWGPATRLTFTADKVQLVPSQFSGTITEIGTTSFTVTCACVPDCGTGTCSLTLPLNPRTVETTAQTVYRNFTPNDFSGLAVDDVVSVNGWVFAQNTADPSLSTPYAVAQTVTLHTEAQF